MAESVEQLAVVVLAELQVVAQHRTQLAELVIYQLAERLLLDGILILVALVVKVALEQVLLELLAQLVKLFSITHKIYVTLQDLRKQCNLWCVLYVSRHRRPTAHARPRKRQKT
jgi:hypothetical protein